MKKTRWILFLIIGMLLSCSDKKKEFVIEGTINNLDGLPLYAVYELGGNLVIDTLRPDNGKISLRNASEALIPIQFYYADKTPFIKIYVKNGDRITLEGNGKEPFGLTVKGSDLNKELFKFYQANKSLLQQWLTERNNLKSGIKSESYRQAHLRLQEVITDYVYKNSNHPVSAILIGDYLLGESDDEVCQSLIEVLSDEVLQSPTAAPIKLYQQHLNSLSISSTLPTFQWITPTDTTDHFDPRKAKVTLLYFQAGNNTTTHHNNRLHLKEWSDKFPTDTLQLIEVSLDRDSAVWHKRIKNDTVKWERRWIQGGYLAQGIERLEIKQLPYSIIADSMGQIIARGLPLDKLEEQIKQIIYPDSIDSSKLE